jgi:hypothetical protein
MLASGEYEGDYDAFIELMDGTAGIVEEFNKVMKEHYDNEKAVYGLQDSEGRTEDVKKKG